MAKILHTKLVKENSGSSIPCSIEVLRLRPGGYTYPVEWVDYVNSMEDRMKQAIAEAHPDDLNDSMFDWEINAASQSPKADAARQRVAHRQDLWDLARRLRGEIDARNSYRNDLLVRLAKIDAEIARCEEAEKVKGKQIFMR